MRPGTAMPGVDGPISTAPRSRTIRTSLSASCTGTPSVMQTRSSTPPASASSTAGSTLSGGTMSRLARALVAATASRHDANTGMPAIGSRDAVADVATPPTTRVP